MYFLAFESMSKDDLHYLFHAILGTSKFPNTNLPYPLQYGTT